MPRHSFTDQACAPRRGGGFSLVELMITLAIAAILLSMAVPSFSELIKNNRLITQTNDFVTALNLARSEAIRRGSRVTVCKSSDQASCVAGGSWEQGWIVFNDVNGNGTVAAATDIIRVHEALTGNVTLSGDAALADYVSYVSSGGAQLIGGGVTAIQAGTLALCDDRGFIDQARAVQISTTGRVSSGSATAIAASCTP